MIGRRHMLAGLSVALSGCGFHPLYGGGATRTARLAGIYVDTIPNRAGQLLRLALQSRLEGSTDDMAKQFTLGVSYYENIQGLGVQSDNSTTRARDVGTAVWSLRAAGQTDQLAGGTVRSLDGYNIIDEQFFYADLSQDAVEHRLASALADQIVTGIAVYFDKHPG
jgi:LPS-assembly lipoprotein